MDWTKFCDELGEDGEITISQKRNEDGEWEITIRLFLDGFYHNVKIARPADIPTAMMNLVT